MPAIPRPGLAVEGGLGPGEGPQASGENPQVRLHPDAKTTPAANMGNAFALSTSAG